ncbi:DNA starvation/stationary phase protection protein Dps [Phreatobacter aquaticus]|nr:DNA starvation/stationary phase protection protein Dps [Phreatobacter aquaticus]
MSKTPSAKRMAKSAAKNPTVKSPAVKAPTSSPAFVSDLKTSTRAAMIALLNKRLADAIDLKLAVKQAHWNIKGPSFIGIHLLLDEVSGRVEDHYDTIAERCVQLGGTAHGTLQSVAKATSLTPYPTDATAQDEHVRQISDHLGAFAKNCREAVDDADEAGDAITADIFTSIARAVDKDHWFIGAHLG